MLHLVFVIQQAAAYAVVDLLQCTHEANVSVPQLADLLIQRTQSTNWVVVFKGLITVHNIMNYGNEVTFIYCRLRPCVPQTKCVRTTENTNSLTVLYLLLAKLIQYINHSGRPEKFLHP